MLKNKFFSVSLTLVLFLSLFGFSTPSDVHAEGTNEVQFTPFFTILYGTITMANGSPAPTGTVVQLITPRGEAAGEWTVDENIGILKFTHAYGTDGLGTPGFRLGEEIHATVNGVPFNIWPRITWSNDWDIHQVEITPITKMIKVTTSGGPRSLSFKTDTKILIHATSCFGAIANEVNPGITTLDTGNPKINCGVENSWIYFETIPLEQGQEVEVSGNPLGWGQGEYPYLGIWERKEIKQIFLTIIAR